MTEPTKQRGSGVRGVYYNRQREQWWIHVVHTHADGSKTEVRQRSPINTKRGAEDYRNKTVIPALVAGTWKARVGVPTLAELRDEWFTNLRAKNTKPKTLAFYSDQLEWHLLPEFGKKPIDRIVGPDLDAWIDRRKTGGAAQATVNCSLRTLKAALNFGAVRHKTARPVIPIPKLKKVEGGKRFLPFDEADRVVETSRAHGQWHAFCVVGMRAGLRVGELFGLQWDDLDWTERRVNVRRAWSWDEEGAPVLGPPKGNRSRQVPLTGQAADALKALRHLRGSWVFCEEGGAPITRRGAERGHLQTIAKHAGVKLFGVHVLRHTFGSHCAMKGYSLRQIQEWMGHESITTTEGYAHLMPTASGALDRLDEAIRQ